MSTTDKALHDNKLSQLALGGGAAASILLPQAVTKAMPQLFAGIAPVTAQTLPYCTGVCGSPFRWCSWKARQKPATSESPAP